MTTITIPQHLRRLQPDELVCAGDFVADGQRGFELWEGPGGFRAGSFVKPVYRLNFIGPLQPDN